MAGYGALLTTWGAGLGFDEQSRGGRCNVTRMRGRWGPAELMNMHPGRIAGIAVGFFVYANERQYEPK